MNFRDYQQLALKTEMLTYDDVAKRILMKNRLRLLHGIYINSEIKELEDAINNADQINIIEEVGDCAWYINLMNDYFQVIEKKTINLDYVIEKPANLQDLTIIKQKAALIEDNFKKVVYYNKFLDIDKNFIEPLQELYNEFKNQFGDIWEEALSKNIEKLKKRYPDKYKDDKANNRDLQAEYEVLKQSYSKKYDK